MQTRARSRASGPPQGSASLRSNPGLESSAVSRPSAMLASPAPSRKTTSPAKSPTSAKGTRKPKSSQTSEAASTSRGKDCVPYWNASCAEISSDLWLPTAIDSAGSALNSLNTWCSSTVENSWFSTSLLMPAPQTISPRISWPSSPSSPPACTDSASTARRSRKIRIYPTLEQAATFRRWLGASRFVYNQTVSYLNGLEEGPRPSWMLVALTVLHALPEWASEIPFQVKKIAVRDACEALTNGKRKAKLTGKPFRLSFRSRKDPMQSCFIPASAVKSSGIYPTISGRGLLFSESLPPGFGDCRLVCRDWRWYVCTSYEVTINRADNQGRIVALDPGVRTFQTFFSADQAGKLGQGDIGHIVRLCYALDDILSRQTKAPARKRRSYRKAAARIRWRIRDLIDELHHKCARFFVDNYDVILLPTFEVSQMVRRARRKIRSKTVRSMLTLSHFRFKQFLKSKAFEAGKLVVDVNEAYTTKTASWSGEIVNVGGSKTIRGSDGVTMDRDYNGARGIYLRALRDTSTLLTERALVSEG